MQFSTVTAAITLFAALAHASPTPSRDAARLAARQFQAQLTFYGAANAEFQLSVPADGSEFAITNPLSISYINSEGGASCSFNGIDGSYTTVVGAQTVVVGPPQTQISGSCLAL